MKREPVKIYPDGREVCSKSVQGKRLYSDRTYAMSRRQGFRCAICHRVFPRAEDWTFDHQNGRGMGGAIRDDRIEVYGHWFNAALCVLCQGLKGSKRYHWIKENGQMKYVPQTPNPA